MSLSLKRSLILLAALILAYSPVLFTSSPVDPDSQLIIPHLTTITGPIEYISKLFSFQTIDVQPVRDISLYFDIKVFDLTGFNSLVTINLFIWFAACLAVFEIFKGLFPDMDEKKLFLLTVAFALYPLFTQSVAWGMARKHLLSFFFITLATLSWIRNEKKSILFYFLSVLSQPITILWPLWAFSYKRDLSKVLPLFVLMFIAVATNFFYYKYSPTILSIYGSKTNEISNLPEMLLALGHYTYQLICPYLLSATYELGHWSSLVGLVLIVLLLAAVIKVTKERSFVVSWSLYMLLPLFIVLTKPSFLYDTYLLMPGLGLLILVTGTWKSLFIKIPDFALIILCAVWGVLSLYENMGWTNETELTARSYLRRPGCKSAFQHIRSSYENGDRPLPAARHYLAGHDCSQLNISLQHVINVAASMAYYEEESPVEERLTVLKDLARRGIYPELVLAAFYLRRGQSDNATQTLNDSFEHWEHMRFRNEYIPLADQVLRPFCESSANTNCLKLLAPFVTKRKSLSYK